MRRIQIERSKRYVLAVVFGYSPHAANGKRSQRQKHDDTDDFGEHNEVLAVHQNEPKHERNITTHSANGKIARLIRALLKQQSTARFTPFKGMGQARRSDMTFKKNIGALVLAATAITGFSATPATARDRYDDNYGYSDRDYRYDRENARYERDYRESRYEDREYRRAERDYRNNSNRCGKGTGGTIIGAVAGGLLGNQVARRGNRTEGSIIGAAVGALAGRAIDKSGSNCNRRYR